jgi:DNA invertase Pin-like site-specific DNA recombinase
LNTFLHSETRQPLLKPNVAIFVYGRVSTKEQSTENQRLEIVAAGYAVDYWFADEGVSGKVMAQQRPQFAKLLTQIRNGKTLVVSKLDRLGRDAHDVGGTIELLASRTHRNYRIAAERAGSGLASWEDDAGRRCRAWA